MLGIEEFFDSLINEAKSPEEIRKTLEYQFIKGKGVSPDLFNDVFEEDPTSKKTYTRWLFSKWDEEKGLIEEIIRNGDFKRLFDYFKSRQNNGLNLSAFKTVDSAIGMLPEVDRVIKKIGNGGPEDDYDLVYDEDDWKIAVPHTYEASKKLGKGCRWCTAEGFGDNPGHFNQYTKNYGPLWINFKMGESEIGPKDNKEYPYTRYQFCFESGDYKDSDDIDITSFDDIGLPEEVRDFYAEQNPRYGTIIDENAFKLSEEEYIRQRRDEATVVKNYNGHTLCIMQEWNDDHVFDDDYYYYVYDTDFDTSDPIKFENVENTVNAIVKNYEESSCVILSSLNDSYLIYYISNHDTTYYRCCVTSDESEDSLFYNDNVVIAVTEDGEDIFVHFPKQDKSSNVDGAGVQIKTFGVLSGLPIKDRGREVYDANSYYIVLSYDDGEKGLLKVNAETASVDIIVYYDKPINGEYFEVEYIDGVVFLVTENYRYCLDEDMASEKNKYTYSEDINGRFVIVKTKDRQELKNVYDKETNKLVLNIPAGKILPSSFIDITYLDDPDYSKIDQLIVSDNANRNAYIFDLETGKQVSKVYECYYVDYFGSYGTRYVFCYSNNRENIDIYRVNGLKLEPLGKFYRVYEIDLQHGFVTTTPQQTEALNLYNIEGSLLFENVIDINPTNRPRSPGSAYDRCVILKKCEQDDCIVLDKRDKKILFDGLRLIVKRNNGFVFETNDGKNLFISDIDKSTPFIRVFDKIVKLNPYHSAAVIENGRLYFIDLSRKEYSKLSPENGIDPSVIQKIDTALGGVADFEITTVNGERFLCDADIPTFKNFNTGKLVNNPFETKLDEIRFGFKELLDRINNPFI